MLPTLRQLEYVVSVADTGQFVEAARQCGVSQPALSRQVREVEDLLGVQLFERVRPRVLVTEVGREIVQRARGLLAEARDLVEVGRASRSAYVGTLTLGVIPTIAPYGLPGLLAKLRTLFPQVSVVVHELQTDTLLRRLRAGTVDLALLARPFDAHGLAGVDLVHEPFVLVASSDHALGVAEAVDPEDLAGASLILLEDGHCLRDQAIEVCALAGAPPATSVLSASVSTLVRLVESGLGPTLLPVSALDVELRGGGLVARSFRGRQPGRTLALQWRQSSPHSQWFGQIATLLHDHYGTLNVQNTRVHGPVPTVQSLLG